MRRALITAAALSTALVGIAACGGDDDDEAPSTAAYCAALEETEDGGGGPLDAFFEEHPDPTLEDWAAALPGVIDDIEASRDELAAIDPSEELAEERGALITSLDGMIEHFERSVDAAEAGDQAEFDALEEQNMSELSPAVGEAMQAIMAGCGAETETGTE